MEHSKDDILRVLDQYVHVRKDREIMAVYLTDYPGSLERLAEECDFIQAEAYKNSSFFGKRNDGVLYYDCTNY